MNISRIKRTVAIGGATLIGAAGLAFATVSPASAAAYTCHGYTATIVGTNGSNEINGTSGRDVIVGLGGNDEIDGGSGNDWIRPRRPEGTPPSAGRTRPARCDRQQPPAGCPPGR